MNETHEYLRDGIKWERIWHIPQASFDCHGFDPYDPKDFIKRTSRKDNLGAILDRAKEYSIKREEKDGVDNVKSEYYKNWSKRRKDKEHPDILQNKLVKDLNKKGIEVEF